VFCQIVAITVVCILFLKTSSIREKYLEEVRRPPRAIHGFVEALCDETREVACVVDVSVGDEYGIERRGIKRGILPIAVAKFLQALKQAAIDEHPTSIASK
jgi:hypothetical protein